jgi:hypothetical protein
MRIVLITALALLACSSSERPPSPKDAPVAAPVLEPPPRPYADDDQAPRLRRVVDFIQGADEVRFVQLVENPKLDGPERFQPSGELRLLAGNDLTAFTTLLASVVPVPLMERSACTFRPDMRVVATSGDRTLTAEICFGCDQLKVDKGTTLDIQFLGSGDTLEAWARQIFRDPTIGTRI